MRYCATYPNLHSNVQIRVVCVRHTFTNRAFHWKTRLKNMRFRKTKEKGRSVTAGIYHTSLWPPTLRFNVKMKYTLQFSISSCLVWVPLVTGPKQALVNTWNLIVKAKTAAQQEICQGVSWSICFFFGIVGLHSTGDIAENVDCCYKITPPAG